ncbi:MAG: electron transfer flavoprotein subunit beta/FixA family protein [Candidatus Geothermarchaeales archaeon]
MNTIVCVKAIYSPERITVDKRTGKVVLRGLPTILNPPDRVAVEAALRLRDAHGGKVSTITMGRTEAEDPLREALAMGVDEAYLLCDEAFGDEPHTTATLLSYAIRKMGAFDLILCGARSLDGNNAQVGPQLGELLDLPVVAEVGDVRLEEGRLMAEERLGNNARVVKTPLPALATLCEDAYKPRYPSTWGIYEAYHLKTVTWWSRKDLDITEELEAEGPPVQTRRVFPPELEERRQEILRDPPAEAARELARRILRLGRDG